MSRLLFFLLISLIGTPLVLPVVELVHRPSGFSALLETPRIASLAGNTAALAFGAILLAVPIGAAAAVLIERFRVPGRMLLRGLVLLGVFVPLPVYAAGWLAALPDSNGLLLAIWIHAVAGVPWVAAFVMLGLRTADPQLEDDARLSGGTRAVVRNVLWPRVRAHALAGGCWVGVQALTESTVTDLLMVRTFAEEVYFQLVGNPAGVAGAVVVTLPVWLASCAIALALLKPWLRSGLTGVAPTRRESRPVFAAGIVAWLGVFVLVGLPFAGLATRTGGATQLIRVARVHGLTLADSLLWGGVAGLLAAGLALGASWLARGSRRWFWFLLVLTTIAWITPAALVGLGLKTAIGWLVSVEDAILGPDAAFPPVRSLLYDQPSPLPEVWAYVIRFFPIAVAMLWPAVRNIPRELLDVATLDGGQRAIWRGAVWPWVRWAFVCAAAAVTILSLGEVIASKLAQAPGRQSFIQELFNAMHYGADSTVAALCLLQIGATAGLCAILCFLFGRARSG